MLVSRLTSKGQTTVPAEVRKALKLKTGDFVMFELKNHEAILSKIEPFDVEYHRSLSKNLSEWSSGNDDEAYDDL